MPYHSCPRVGWRLSPNLKATLPGRQIWRGVIKMPENGIHLENIKIEGFRGINELSIPSLGHVTLLTGKNSVGKTTVLDAMRVFASRGGYSTLYEMLEDHDELYLGVDEDGDNILIPDVRSLFYGRNPSHGNSIKIGPKNPDDQLMIDSASADDIGESIQNSLPPGFWDTDTAQIVRVTFRGMKRIIPLGVPLMGRRFNRRLSDDNEIPATIKCESLGPGVLTNQDLARFWDNVALTDDEKSAIESLSFIFGDSIEGVAVVGDDVPRFRPPILLRGGRRVMVKIKSNRRPVPLRSLGDGASRMFGVSMALANSRDGFLLLDEAENGIHHSLQHDFWRMVLRTALTNNVQVLATTHSWDCVRGFALASVEHEEVEGLLYRLEKQQDEFRMVDYSKEDLKIVAEQGIEVR